MDLSCLDNIQRIFLKVLRHFSNAEKWRDQSHTGKKQLQNYVGMNRNAIVCACLFQRGVTTSCYWGKCQYFKLN